MSVGYVGCKQDDEDESDNRINSEEKLAVADVFQTVAVACLRVSGIEA